MEELRYRQIHMDFHTSEKIEHVAERFEQNRICGNVEKCLCLIPLLVLRDVIME